MFTTAQTRTRGTGRICMFGLLMTVHSMSVEGSESVEETLRPYRHLAMRVLALALLDLSNPVGLPADRESARLFLKGSRMLRHWCRVAAVDPSCMVKLAEKLGVGPRPSRA